MDEEQGLASPIAGGLRGIRRTISSSIFGGRRAPMQAQPDTITTRLLQQNSLSLNNVSAQLSNISAQVSGLNGSLLAIKENLAVSDTLERQREIAKQNREAILAEQGLREGKESQIESRIQQALTFPVRRLAQKTQFGLSRLTNFFLILAGGWLTNTVVNLIKATSEGNIDLMNQLKTELTKGLLIAGGTLTALGLGLKGIRRGLGFVATTAFRIGKTAILKRPFTAITLTLAALLNKAIPSTGNKVVDIGLGFAIGGTSFVTFQFLKKQLVKLFPKQASKVKAGMLSLLDDGAKVTTSTVGKKGFMGLLRKVALPFKGKGGAIGTFLIDMLIFGTPIDESLVGAGGFLAGVKAGAAAGGFLGGLFGGIGAAPGALIGGIIGGFLGPEVFKGLYKGIKTFLGFKTSDDDVVVEGTGDESALLGEPTLFNMGGKVVGEGNKDTVPALLTPGEFVITKDATERIGASFFESINAGNTIDKSITPINKITTNNIAENISNLEEGAPEIINFPVPNTKTQGANGTAQSSSTPTNDIPFIGFDNNNSHTLFATSRYGANA